MLHLRGHATQSCPLPTTYIVSQRQEVPPTKVGLEPNTVVNSAITACVNRFRNVALRNNNNLNMHSQQGIHARAAQPANHPMSISARSKGPPHEIVICSCSRSHE